MSREFVFVDDSGDPGFKDVSSVNFVMASAVFMSYEVATKVNEVISEYRKELGWQDVVEFKFSKTNKQILETLLRKVSRFDFGIYAVYINKNSFRRILPLIDTKKLYNWTIKELLKLIPLEDAFVRIDGRSNKEYEKRVAAYLRHEVNAEKRKIKDIRAVDSTKDNLIQLADVIAGSINRSMQLGKTDNKKYLAIINKKIIRVEQLRPEI